MIRSFTDKKTEAVFNGISPKGFPADLISLGFIEVPPMQPLPPLHPGEVLREEFMEPLGLTAYALAKACRVPRTRIERIAREEIGITADTALRLGRCQDDASVLAQPPGRLRHARRTGADRRYARDDRAPQAGRSVTAVGAHALGTAGSGASRVWAGGAPFAADQIQILKRDNGQSPAAPMSKLGVLGFRADVVAGLSQIAGRLLTSASPTLLIKGADELVGDDHAFDSRLGHDHECQPARRVHGQSRAADAAPAVSTPRLRLLAEPDPSAPPLRSRSHSPDRPSRSAGSLFAVRSSRRPSRREEGVHRRLRHG